MNVVLLQWADPNWLSALREGVALTNIVGHGGLSDLARVLDAGSAVARRRRFFELSHVRRADRHSRAKHSAQPTGADFDRGRRVIVRVRTRIGAIR